MQMYSMHFINLLITSCPSALKKCKKLNVVRIYQSVRIGLNWKGQNSNPLKFDSSFSQKKLPASDENRGGGASALQFITLYWMKQHNKRRPQSPFMKINKWFSLKPVAVILSFPVVTFTATRKREILKMGDDFWHEMNTRLMVGAEQAAGETGDQQCMSRGAHTLQNKSW